MNSQESCSRYSKKFASTKKTRANAEMKLLIYSTVHNVAFEHFGHLIKTVQEAFPDSEIAKNLKMSRFSASYHLRFGLAKTEMDLTCADLRKNLFSAALDAGTKGNKKRTEILVRYWSKDQNKIVEKFFKSVQTNHETALIVSKLFLEIMKDNKIPLRNLLMIHSDSSSILRGKKAGAIKKISEEAPHILCCDIGGDGLHHVHNAEKKAFVAVYSDVVKVLTYLKYDIRASPAKIEDYINSCKVAEEKETKPVSFCISRWLDKYEAVDDIINHLESLKDYYRQARVVKRKNTYTAQDTSEDSLTSSDEHTNKKKNKKDNFQRDPAKRVEYLKKVFLDNDVSIEIELQLILARSCMKEGYDFLKIFQSQEVKIHLLYDAYYNLLRNILLEICAPSSLKNSKGEKLSGRDLKDIVLDTKNERDARKQKENEDKQVSVSKKKKVNKNETSVRRALVICPKDVLICSKVKNDIKSLMENYDVTEKEKKKAILNKSITLKLQFHVELAIALQHFLPLDNDWLRWLKYLCPKKMTESSESEAYIVKIAEKVPSITEEEYDDLRKEVRILKDDKDKYFGEELEVYIENYVEGFKLVKGKIKNKSIDAVWKKVINNDIFPVLAKVLKATLSIFHSTGSVEGSINTTRNILGERSHRMTDENLSSRKLVKSAVKVANTNCCYDYDVNRKSMLDNWFGSYKSYSTRNSYDNSESNTTDDKSDTEVVGKKPLPVNDLEKGKKKPLPADLEEVGNKKVKADEKTNRNVDGQNNTKLNSESPILKSILPNTIKDSSKSKSVGPRSILKFFKPL